MKNLFYVPLVLLCFASINLRSEGPLQAIGETIAGAAQGATQAATQATKTVIGGVTAATPAPIQAVIPEPVAQAVPGAVAPEAPYPDYETVYTQEQPETTPEITSEELEAPDLDFDDTELGSSFNFEDETFEDLDTD